MNKMINVAIRQLKTYRRKNYFVNISMFSSIK